MPLPAAITEDHLEPIPLPDIRRLEQTPSWPAWVALRIGSLKVQKARDRQTGHWRDLPTLPPSLMPKAAEREVLQQHIAEVEKLCGRTPATDSQAAREMLALLTRLMMTLPAPGQNEFSIELRGEAFMGALEDLPPWALQGAIARWHRGECGADHRGEQYHYHWCPAPAELRRIALLEVGRMRRRVHEAQLLLRAEPHNEFSDEHCQEMRKRLAHVFSGFKAPPVGTDGSGGVVGES
jgi:hypothetical protein